MTPLMRKVAFFLFCTVLCLGACKDTGGYETISAAKAKELMDAASSYVLLDVRTEAEFAERHIPGALLLAHTDIKSRAKDVLPDKNVPVFIYCRSGRRSAIAAKELVGMGYTRVYDFGGIKSWPYDVVSNDKNKK